MARRSRSRDVREGPVVVVGEREPPVVLGCTALRLYVLVYATLAARASSREAEGSLRALRLLLVNEAFAPLEPEENDAVVGYSPSRDVLWVRPNRALGLTRLRKGLAVDAELQSQPQILYAKRALWRCLSEFARRGAPGFFERTVDAREVLGKEEFERLAGATASSLVRFCGYVLAGRATTVRRGLFLLGVSPDHGAALCDQEFQGFLLSLRHGFVGPMTDLPRGAAGDRSLDALRRLADDPELFRVHARDLLRCAAESQGWLLEERADAGLVGPDTLVVKERRRSVLYQRQEPLDRGGSGILRAFDDWTNEVLKNYEQPLEFVLCVATTVPPPAWVLVKNLHAVLGRYPTILRESRLEVIDGDKFEAMARTWLLPLFGARRDDAGPLASMGFALDDSLSVAQRRLGVHALWKYGRVLVGTDEALMLGVALGALDAERPWYVFASMAQLLRSHDRWLQERSLTPEERASARGRVAAGLRGVLSALVDVGDGGWLPLPAKYSWFRAVQDVVLARMQSHGHDDVVRAVRERVRVLSIEPHAGIRGGWEGAMLPSDDLLRHWNGPAPSEGRLKSKRRGGSTV